MKYQWLVFDADHTLFDFDRSEKTALFSTLAAFQLPVDESLYRAYQAINKPLWKQLEGGQMTPEELKRQRTIALFEHIRSAYWQHTGVTDRLKRLSHASFLAHYLNALAEKVCLLPDVEHTLKRLSRQCRLLILTNGIHAMQKQRLKNSGLEPLFVGLVSSDRFGVAKPDRRIFEHALEQLGSPPRHQVLMIGDNLRTDIGGAQQAGLASCWIHPAASTPPAGPVQPTHRITRMKQLLPIVLPTPD